MLANQIEVNLELREQYDHTCELLEQYRVKEGNYACELNRFKDENADLKLQIFELKDSSNGGSRNLQEKIKFLEESLYNKDANIETIVNEKDQRINELER